MSDFDFDVQDEEEPTMTDIARQMSIPVLLMAATPAFESSLESFRLGVHDPNKIDELSVKIVTAVADVVSQSTDTTNAEAVIALLSATGILTGSNLSHKHVGIEGASMSAIVAAGLFVMSMVTSQHADCGEEDPEGPTIPSPTL